jgi:hypothetical protein
MMLKGKHATSREMLDLLADTHGWRITHSHGQWAVYVRENTRITVDFNAAGHVARATHINNPKNPGGEAKITHIYPPNRRQQVMDLLTAPKDGTK